MKSSIRRFDESVAKFIGKGPRWLQLPSVWLGRFSTPLLWASYVAFLYISFVTPGLLRGSGLLVIVLLPLASLIKIFVRRKRPPTIFTKSMRIKSYSFPSSHAYAASLAGGHVLLLSLASGQVILAAGIAVLVACIGLSRIFVGAHYPSDVLAGWLLGAVVLALIS